MTSIFFSEVTFCRILRMAAVTLTSVGPNLTLKQVANAGQVLFRVTSTFWLLKMFLETLTLASCVSILTFELGLKVTSYFYQETLTSTFCLISTILSEILTFLDLVQLGIFVTLFS